MPRIRNQRLPDLVYDSKLETYIQGDCTEHVFYEPGRSLRERQKRRVESWEREHRLGNGSFGVVYREKLRGHGRPIYRAVKKISKRVVEGEDLDYIRELEAIAKFSHRRYSHCFVRSEGWFELDDAVFITMEYLEHGDLQKYLTRPFSEAEAAPIVAQVLEGLQFMHSSGFVHRDLKPGNIMVVEKGPSWYVKIADFGISKRRQQGVTTLHTMQRGTLGFAAPEVLGMDNDTESPVTSYDFSVDLWSLGAVTFYLVTNMMAFASSAKTVIRQGFYNEFAVIKTRRSANGINSSFTSVAGFSCYEWGWCFTSKFATSVGRTLAREQARGY
ncbi:unnamed protein product [Clonostachys rosea]|uniref:non-specific serine/threonine protein kinase n=1 Tax=Bionectria ochroleuca TaxID=29856 RepID=A0ABY6UGF2_BIOOC|nr:unnamed protein product [Clonostachys rosea]